MRSAHGEHETQKKIWALGPTVQVITIAYCVEEHHAFGEQVHVRCELIAGEGLGFDLLSKISAGRFKHEPLPPKSEDGSQIDAGMKLSGKSAADTKVVVETEPPTVAHMDGSATQPYA
jgi:hypothetical protein